jgi:arylsulfatase A
MTRPIKTILRSMILKLRRYFLFSLLVLFSLLIITLIKCSSSRSKLDKPNIVFIMIDDLGYGDVACFGSKFIKTPNIDRMAAEGLKFTDFHSNGPVCSPTRAALMTGMYQYRLGSIFESPLSGKTTHDSGMPLEVVTIAEVLKESGYATGMYGKWHLGYLPPYLPNNQGFDDFWGLGSGDGDHHTHVDRWGREDWWHNDKLYLEDGYSADLITDHSIQFIHDHMKKPFFLYVAHLAIHFPWQGPDDPPHRLAGSTYENDKWGMIPDKNNVGPHVKAMVEVVDEGVGEIIQTLKNLGLEENTLVIFTSDNGGYLHYANEFHNISSNGPLRGQKGEVYEGGHRVPGIAYWPGMITPATTDETVLSMDMFPTFVSLAEAKIHEDNIMDGVDITPLLLHGTKLPERLIYWKIGNDIAVRQGSWKLVMRDEEAPELYNLKEDIGEINDLSKIHHGIVSDLLNEYEEWYLDMENYALRWN